MLVSSFHLPELWEFKQLAPEIPVAALVAGVPLDWAGCAIELGAAALNISSEFVDPRLLADAHAHGIRVNVYTVNDPDEMRALRAIGVDGVFSDYPERALQL
jgi:glycerophosphoryl diester phosphodiesterase